MHHEIWSIFPAFCQFIRRFFVNTQVSILEREIAVLKFVQKPQIKDLNRLNGVARQIFFLVVVVIISFWNLDWHIFQPSIHLNYYSISWDLFNFFFLSLKSYDYIYRIVYLVCTFRFQFKLKIKLLFIFFASFSGKE